LENLFFNKKIKKTQKQKWNSKNLFLKNVECLDALVRDVVSVLNMLGYKITKRVCNTRDHGIPQSRPRLYIIAIRKSCHVRKFPWPSPVKAPPLLRFVDNSKAKKDTINDLGATALANVLYWRREKKQSDGIDILALPYVLDVGASPKFRCMMLDCSPCLTKSRAGTGGHFITCLRRTMTIADIGRLQGAPTALVESAGGDTSKVGCPGRRDEHQRPHEALAPGAVERGCDRCLAPRHLVEDASAVWHPAGCLVCTRR
jgi:site-specific DNA-cytosine methylase